jgi:hypothetical protein
MRVTFLDEATRQKEMIDATHLLTNSQKIKNLLGEQN